MIDPISPVVSRFAKKPLVLPKSSATQLIEGIFEDKSDPNALRASDRSGNGNYALQDTEYSVVDAGVAERACATFSGLDYLKIPGSGWIEDLIRGADKSFILDVDFIPSEVNLDYLFDISTTDFSARYVTLFLENASIVFIRYGLADYELADITLNVNEKNNIKVEFDRSVNEIRYSINDTTGTLLLPAPNDAEWTDALIGARTASSPAASFMGNIISFRFKQIDGTLVEEFRFDEGSGTTAFGVNGNTGTYTDGTPVTFWDNGIAKKITLNNTSLVGPAGYPANGVALTKAEIGALHDGDTMFATPPDNGTFRFVLGSGLTAEQKTTFNKYVRR